MHKAKRHGKFSSVKFAANQLNVTTNTQNLVAFLDKQFAHEHTNTINPFDFYLWELDDILTLEDWNKITIREAIDELTRSDYIKLEGNIVRLLKKWLDRYNK